MNWFIRNKPYGLAHHSVEGQLPTPPVLHVCHESRTEGQKYYYATDDSDRWIPGQLDEVDGTRLNSRDVSEMLRPLYINFEADYFVQPVLTTSIPPWVPRSKIAHNFGPDVLQRIRFLQVEASSDTHQAALGRLAIEPIEYLLVQMASLSEPTLAIRQAFVKTPRYGEMNGSMGFSCVQLSFQDEEKSTFEELRKSLTRLHVPSTVLEKTVFRCRLLPHNDEDLVPVSKDIVRLAL